MQQEKLYEIRKVTPVEWDNKFCVYNLLAENCGRCTLERSVHQRVYGFLRFIVGSMRRPGGYLPPITTNATDLRQMSAQPHQLMPHHHVVPSIVQPQYLVTTAQQPNSANNHGRTGLTLAVKRQPLINKQCGLRVRPTRYAPARL